MKVLKKIVFFLLAIISLTNSYVLADSVAYGLLDHNPKIHYSVLYFIGIIVCVLVTIIIFSLILRKITKLNKLDKEKYENSNKNINKEDL